VGPLKFAILAPRLLPSSLDAKRRKRRDETMLKAAVRLPEPLQAASEHRKGLTPERHRYLDELVDRSRLAAAAFYQFSQEQVDRCVRAMVLKGLEAAQQLAALAVMAGLAFANAFVGVNHALAHSLGSAFKIPHGRANAVLLPYVVRYNAAVPSKFMPFPNVKAYVAHRKYAQFAEAMSWGGSNEAEKVDILIAKIFALLDSCKLPASIKELGIAADDFERTMPDIIRAAFDDISFRSNPRMPLIKELEEILRTAYAGRREA
jgi:alcohol dehydrogenase class IV